MNFSKAVKALLLTIVLATSTTLAQQQMQMPTVVPADSVSDEELNDFVSTAMKLQGVKMQTDQKVVAKLQEEEITVQRFQQIMMSKQNPNAQVELTEAEEESMQVIQPFLQQVSMEAQQQQMQIVQQSELSQQRFQSIAAALQTDQELAARVQELAQQMGPGAQ